MLRRSAAPNRWYGFDLALPVARFHPLVCLRKLRDRMPDPTFFIFSARQSGAGESVEAPLMKFVINRALILSQIRANIVAIFSIIVALTGMAYNTWRNEKTEINHSVRIAAFETLKNLGEAQIVVEYLHFQKNRQLGDPVQGWGRMIYIRDLAQVLPAPGPAEAERLWVAWRDNVEGLGTNDEAMVKITDEMQLLRLTTLEILGGLR
jgi:hypothetical protein